MSREAREAMRTFVQSATNATGLTFGDKHHNKTKTGRNMRLYFATTQDPHSEGSSDFWKRVKSLETDRVSQQITHDMEEAGYNVQYVRISTSEKKPGVPSYGIGAPASPHIQIRLKNHQKLRLEGQSFLKDILVELQNCVQDDHSEVGVNLPVAWSRDFAQKLKKNTDHWDKVRKLPPHLRTADEEQEEFDDLDRPDRDFDREYEYAHRDEDDRIIDVGDDEDYEYNFDDEDLLGLNRGYEEEQEFADDEDDRIIDVGDDEDYEQYSMDDDWSSMFGGPGGRSRDIHDSTFDEFEEENDDEWMMRGGEDRLSARSDRDMSDSEPFGDDRYDDEYDYPEDEDEDEDDDWRMQGGEDRLSARSDRDMSDSEPFGEFEEEQDDNVWHDWQGRAWTLDKNEYPDQRRADFDEEQEEAMHAPVSAWTKKFLAQQAEENDECPDCFGTGQQFPDLKDDCPSCKSNKAKVGRFKDFYSTEEQEEDELSDQEPQENPDAQDPTNQAVDDQYGQDDPNDDSAEFDDVMGVENQEWDDPNYQGVLRTVNGAHLVYKRQQEDGTFNELWMYNIGDDFKQELEIRRSVLAGTDIPINKMRSPDNTQTYELWTIGNGQMMSVKGLPN